MRERVRACVCFCLELHATHVPSLRTHAQCTQKSVYEIPYRERLARKAAIPALASQIAHTRQCAIIYSLQSRQVRLLAVRCALLAAYWIAIAAATLAAAAPCLTRLGHACSRRDGCTARTPAHFRCMHATRLQECSSHRLSGLWRASFRLIFVAFELGNGSWRR
jgi:hypothetical protein